MVEEKHSLPVIRFEICNKWIQFGVVEDQSSREVKCSQKSVAVLQWQSKVSGGVAVAVGREERAGRRCCRLTTRSDDGDQWWRC